MRGNVNQMQGQLLAGRYRLGDAIGSGGMGRVWRAHDEVLHRVVAIKELTAALYVAEGDRAVLLARTRGEARAAARINHPAVVTVHDVLEHDGRPWIVMELVEGRSLADAVKDEERVAPREAARIGLWVLRALRAAHAAGVLHRDVKPGNVLLGADGRVLLTDFGIAQIEGDSTITRTGEVVGSVDYLAPERVRGHDPGPSSDLWALGATLYTAVEGRSPFRRTSPLSTMQAVVEEEAAPPRHAGPLEPVVSALLRKDPATRPSAEEAEQMLAEAAEGRRSDAAQAYVPTQAVTHPASPGDAAGPRPADGRPPADGAVPPPAGGPTAVTPAPGRHGADLAHPGHAGHPAYAGYSAYHGPPGGTPTTSTTAPAPSGMRRARTVVLAVVVAALVGGGTAVLLRATEGGDGTKGDSAVSVGPTVTAGATEGTRGSGGSESPDGSGGSDSAGTSGGAVPADWVRREDPFGFSLSLPADWTRQVYGDDGDLRQVDYTPDGGEHFLRVAVDTSPDFDDPYAHQLSLEEQLQRLADYQRVTLEENDYRDRPSARWEYTWTALAEDTSFPGPRRAVEEMYLSRDGVEYALYMSSPVDDWATASEQFEAVLRSWREGTA
ncbi:serine/threonine protein kinase [Streptomyces daghestanicus]|nr:serine/threonine protein kinase [Streptomyces griseoviridis]GGU21664.1 serine/threonine protein kinase [Streptomyces daghestanicus]GHI31449.1 serine/threonine protein kinase [Streptomyces daghestanicus]